MGQEILLIDFDNENMVGSWNNALFLSQTEDGRYTVRFQQTAEEYPLELPPIGGLKDGRELYQALQSLVEQSEMGIEGGDWNKIAAVLEHFNATLAQEFRAARRIKRAAPSVAKRPKVKRRISKKREARLRALAESYDFQSTRNWVYSMIRADRRGGIYRYARNWLLVTGEYPTGSHDIPYHPHVGPQGQSRYDVIEVDFDELHVRSSLPSPVPAR